MASLHCCPDRKRCHHGHRFWVAYIVRFDLSIPIFKQDAMPSLSDYQTLVMILIPIWLGIFAMAGLYNRKNLLGGTREYSLIFNSTTIGMFTVISAGFLGPEFIFACGWLLLAWAFVLPVYRYWPVCPEANYLFSARARLIPQPSHYHWRKRRGNLLAEQPELNLPTARIGFRGCKRSVSTRIFRTCTLFGKVDQLEAIIQAIRRRRDHPGYHAFLFWDNMLDIFKTYGVSSGVNVRMSSGLYEIITTGLTVKRVCLCPSGRDQPAAPDRLRHPEVGPDYSLTIPGIIRLRSCY
jgi:hypothetical protein